MKSEASPETVDDYIATFPAAVQKRLSQMRRVVLVTAPKAQSKISYGMPAFVLGRNRIYFAAFKKHIGLYPGPAAIVEFKDALVGFHTSKGAIQFPFDAPLPLPLIKQIIRFQFSK
ncbi:MAG TPA: DUF1801 domain-containing protein [Pseudomonadales bacterium]